MVSIFTYRDERKLLAVVTAIIVAATITLIQIDAAKTGRPSPIAVAVGSAYVIAESAIAATSSALGGAATTVANIPSLTSRNAELERENRALRKRDAALSEALGEAPAAAAIAAQIYRTGTGIAASAVGYDPENAARIVTLDRGSNAGIARDDGVVDDDGVVGRVIATSPLGSTVLLATDAASKIPAIVARGRWWGIAAGTDGRIRLLYVSQDAKLRVGDVVVTGRGRSFRAGIPIGRVVRVEHPAGALYVSALLEPAVGFARLERVAVIPAAATP